MLERFYHPVLLRNSTRTSAKNVCGLPLSVDEAYVALKVMFRIYLMVSSRQCVGIAQPSPNQVGPGGGIVSKAHY